MILKEHREITVKANITIGFKCDCCGKIHEGAEMPSKWHLFHGKHNSWGNDSCDSYEDYLACSPECYIRLIREATIQFKDEVDVVIDNFTFDFAMELVKTF